MLRGLFGSSARQAAPFAPELAGAAPNAPAAPAPLLANQEPAAPTSRSYLGGLVKYEPQAGMTGAERMQIIGATLRDVGSGLGGGQGGSLEAVQEGFRARQAKTEKESLMKRLQQMAGELYPDDEEAQLLFKMDPGKFVDARLKEREPEKPVVVNTRLGPRLYHPKSGEYEKLEDIPDKLPFGWKLDENGDPMIDPNFVAGQGQLSNVRAAATAAHRAPPRGRSGGGGGGGGGGSSGGGRRQPWAD